MDEVENREDDDVFDTQSNYSDSSAEEVTPQLIQDQRVKLSQSAGMATAAKAVMPGAYDSVDDSKRRSKKNSVAKRSIRTDDPDPDPAPIDAKIHVVEATMVDESEDIEAMREAMDRDREKLVSEMKKEAQQNQEDMDRKSKRQKRVFIILLAVVLLVGGIVGAVIGLSANTPDVVVVDFLNCQPIEEDLYDAAHCESISKGEEIDDQDSMTEFNFRLRLDVELLNEDENQDYCGLENRIQAYLIPDLAECSRDSPRRLQGGREPPGGSFSTPKPAIGNGKIVDFKVPDDKSCKITRLERCRRVVVDIRLYTRFDPPSPLEDMIEDVFLIGESLTETLELEDSYGEIILVTVADGDTEAS